MCMFKYSPLGLGLINTSSYSTPDDNTVTADETERVEFDVNSSGQMWVGSHDSNSPIPWEYDRVSSYWLSRQRQNPHMDQCM